MLQNRKAGVGGGKTLQIGKRFKQDPVKTVPPTFISAGYSFQ